MVTQTLSALTTTPYASGEFNTGVSNRQFGNTTAIFDNQLFLIGSGGTEFGDQGHLGVTTFNLALDIEQGAATNPRNWVTTQLKVPGMALALTYSRAAAVAVAGDSPGLYLFWHQTKNGFTPPSPLAGYLVMSRYYDDGSTGIPQWHAALALRETDGVTPIKPGIGTNSPPGTDVSATAWGDDTIIVACASAASATSNGQQCLFLGIYNTDDMNLDGGFWPARWQQYLSPSDIANANWGAVADHAIQGVGNRVSIDWFTAPPIGNIGNPTQPPFYLAVLTNPNSNQLKGNAAFLLMAMGVGPSGQLLPPNTAAMRIYELNSTAPYVVKRDPAGRLVLVNAGTFKVGTKPQNALIESIFPTAAAPNESPAALVPAAPVVYSPLAPSLDSVPPANVYFLDLSSPQSTTVDGLPATDYPVYEFVFYSTNVRAQVNRYGTAEVIPNFATYYPCVDPPSCDQTRYIVAGIADAPLPLPNQNVVGWHFEDDNPDGGDVTYGYTQTTEQQHQSSFSLTAGFKSTGSFTKGLGAAWDISFNTGPGSVTGNLNGSSWGEDKTAFSDIDTTADKVGTGVEGLGTLFPAVASMQTTAYRFLDADGNPVSDSTSDTDNQALPWATVQTTFTGTATPNFAPFTVTPGSLDSYMPDQVNQTMNNLGYSGHYFEDVVLPNAYTFPNGLKYMAFGWGTDGEQDVTFQATESTFTEQSWTMDSSVYLGVSGGGGLDIFGMGEEGSWQFLAGVSVSSTTQSTTTTGQQWGIKLSDKWGPPSWGDDSNSNPLRKAPQWPGAMAGYTFLLYFLPVPPASSTLPANYWTRESIRYLPMITNQPIDVSDIDPNSGAWRIFYVVTQYVTNEDYYVNHLAYTKQYNGPLS